MPETVLNAPVVPAKLLLPLFFLLVATLPGCGWFFGSDTVLTGYGPESGRMRTIDGQLTRRQVLNAASPYIGSRYRLGGNTPDGIDCSGFTRAVFLRFGHELPRRSRDQAKHGMQIALRDVQPGDLLFFDTHRSGTINHVAIYLGNRELIHASKNHGVIVDNLSSYYYRRFVMAKRVLVSSNTALR